MVTAYDLPPAGTESPTILEVLVRAKRVAAISDARLRDLQRYVKSVDLLRQTLEKGEVKTLLLLMNGANKSRIFSTNFAIGFFRGAGAMLGVAVVCAIILLIVLNSPYQQEILQFLSQGL